MAIAIPRLHDIGRSGWWVALGFGLELLALVLSLTLLPRELALQGMGVGVLVIFGLLIWLGCVPGEAGPNRFGDPPAGFGAGAPEPAPAAAPQSPAPPMGIDWRKRGDG